MSLGSLVLELQANVARFQEDMGRMNQVAERNLRQIDGAAQQTSRNIQEIGKAGSAIKRVEGAQEAAQSVEKIGHASTGARREILVLIHEISQGNFKRAAGSLLVLGERLDIMGKVMSPMGLAIGGVTLALGALAVAAYKGAEQSREFANALTLTGNYSGQTEGRFRALAENAANAANVTEGSARELAQALLATGRFGSEAYSHMIVSASMFAQVSGQKTEEVVKQYERLIDEPMKVALEWDKQLHFMNSALVDQLRSLEDAGDKQHAAIVVADAVSEAFKRQGYQLKENNGYWQSFKEWVSSATQSVENFFGVATDEDAFDATVRRIAKVRAMARENPDVMYGNQTPASLNRTADSLEVGLRDQSRRLMRNLENAAMTETDQQQREKGVQQNVKWHALLDRYKADKEKEDAELKEAADLATANHASPDELARVQEGIRKRYEHKEPKAPNLDRVDLSLTLQPLQDQMRAEDRALQERDRLLTRRYRDSNVSLEDYYKQEETDIKNGLARKMALYDQEIAAVESAANRTKDARTKAELTRQAGQLRDERQGAQDLANSKLDELTERKRQDMAAYVDEVERLTNELAKLKQTQGDTSGADFDRSHEKLRKQATAAGDTGTLDTLAQMRAATVAQAQIKQLKEQAAAINERLRATEKSLQLDVQTGAKSQVEAWVESGNARKEAAAQLQVIDDKIRAIAADSGLPSLVTYAQQFDLQTKQLTATTNMLGKNVNDVLENGFVKFLNEATSRTKTLKQAVLDMATSIEQAITQIVAKDLANQLFGIGSSGGGGLFGALVNLLGFGGSSGGGGTGSMSALFGLFGRFFGSTALASGTTSGINTYGFTIPGRANGGPVDSGSLYEVNENGPELLSVANRTFLMMGQDSGEVTPMGASNNGGFGHTFNMNIAVPPGTTRQSAQQQAAEIMRHARIAIARNG
ncbi:phage tail length tape measure family protein [Burkholderia pseudomallei]|uniref:phage tail length tape measure family protein n=1 Tax=Burkholderia pseudomallei TaxID=28450 RepID=UPI0018C5BED7|nr:phage tail length tape measure family protein [Burkholderia pseudomallei]MBG1252203.1 phage tail tape measure protein [Burkholderia pseudomallei]